MNLLVLAPLVPYPPHDGDKLRLYHFLTQLKKRGHAIDLFCLTRVKDDFRYAPELLRLCRRLHLEHLSGSDLFFNVLGALLTNRSFNVFSFFSPRFRDALRAYWTSAEGKRVDCILAHRLRMAPYAFEQCPGKPVVLELTDSMTLVTESLRKTKDVRLSRRLAAIWDRASIREEEVHWTTSSARSLLASASDAEYLAQKGALKTRLTVIPNGVSSEKGRLPRPSAYPEGSPIVAFVGNMGYPPNEEGARWFLKEVWPRVKQEVPGAVFAAAGGFPRRCLKKSDNGGDVRITGYLPFIEPYVVHADVTVAPLRVSAGMQNKVALSMSLAVPVVATPGAVSWLPEKAKGWVALASDAEGFARKVAEILKAPRKAKARMRKAAAFIRSHYRWEKAGGMLEAVLKDAVGNHHKVTKARTSTY